MLDLSAGSALFSAFSNANIKQEKYPEDDFNHLFSHTCFSACVCASKYCFSAFPSNIECRDGFFCEVFPSGAVSWSFILNICVLTSLSAFEITGFRGFSSLFTAASLLNVLKVFMIYYFNNNALFKVCNCSRPQDKHSLCRFPCVFDGIVTLAGVCVELLLVL